MIFYSLSAATRMLILLKAIWNSKAVPAVLPPDAADAALECADADVPQHLAADDEETARLMQDVLKADAAASSYLADRSTALKEARAEADRALACMQQQKARAQALVGGTALWMHWCGHRHRRRPAHHGRQKSLQLLSSSSDVINNNKSLT